MTEQDIDKLMDKIDKKCKMPKYWNDFVLKQTRYDNLIIKNIKTKQFYCTNCNKTFKRKKLNVGELYSCPHCNFKYKVYGTNYYRRSFEKSVALLQRMDKQIVVRIFEIYSYFEENNKKIIRDVNEYARIVPGIGTFLGNNTYINTYGVFRIYNENASSWYKYKGCKVFSNVPTYPFNRKRIVKGTKLEYAPIDEFQDRFYRYNFIDTLQIAAYDSFELLWKLKLYNLSLDADKFNKGGSFYNRFKLPKNFLKFMQDNDVCYSQLRVMQLLQNEGIKNMKKYIEHCYNYNNIRFFKKHNALNEYIENYNKFYGSAMKTFKKIVQYVPVKKIINYKQGLENLYLYSDYLEMADKLALNYKAKEDLFPEDLKKRHDELQVQMKVTDDIRHQFGIYLRFLELSKYIYEDEKYIIFPANSSDEFENEGRQQNNCVNYMYSQKYIDKETEIYFMRKLNNMNKSLVTIEFKDKEVRQKEQGKHNNTTEEQNEFIEKWVMFRKFMDKKEIYTNKTKNKVIKYDLKKLVA